jgi:hypothetical protein
VAATAEWKPNGVVIGAALAGAISDAHAVIVAITQLAKVLMNILMLCFSVGSVGRNGQVPFTQAL